MLVSDQTSGRSSTQRKYTLTGQASYQVPPGRYKVAMVTQKRGAGVAVSTGSGNPVFVKPGSTTELKIGDPFALRVIARRADPTTYTFAVSLMGQGGERYRLTDVTESGKLMPFPAPTFKVVDSEGEIVLDDAFTHR